MWSWAWAWAVTSAALEIEIKALGRAEPVAPLREAAGGQAARAEPTPHREPGAHGAGLLEVSTGLRGTVLVASPSAAEDAPCTALPGCPLVKALAEIAKATCADPEACTIKLTTGEYSVEELTIGAGRKLKLLGEAGAEVTSVLCKGDGAQRKARAVLRLGKGAHVVVAGVSLGSPEKAPCGDEAEGHACYPKQCADAALLGEAAQLELESSKAWGFIDGVRFTGPRGKLRLFKSELTSEEEGITGTAERLESTGHTTAGSQWVTQAGVPDLTVELDTGSKVTSLEDGIVLKGDRATVKVVHSGVDSKQDGVVLGTGGQLVLKNADLASGEETVAIGDGTTVRALESARKCCACLAAQEEDEKCGEHFTGGADPGSGGIDLAKLRQDGTSPVRTRGALRPDPQKEEEAITALVNLDGSDDWQLTADLSQGPGKGQVKWLAPEGGGPATRSAKATPVVETPEPAAATETATKAGAVALAVALLAV